ncbi:hypothetical protein BBF96_10820 [Anoxybacter fermentans]|uniref:DNA/RNA helicase n=1 Tax=Anoxybacter fermentans TaxID=1323375 RepID=A0A3Q9HR20_9FIRM|nr:DEAD/DEAH box helicase [Anoxybacter fermentans]AZR73835.1 hypothetical protein BBF96_10820 [Anoxybacter fermentans]
MKCCRVQLYLAGRVRKGFYQVKKAITYDLALDKVELIKEGYEWFWPLTGFISLYSAYLLKERLDRLSWLNRWNHKNEKWLIKRMKKWLKRESWFQDKEVEIFPMVRPVSFKSIPLIKETRTVEKKEVQQVAAMLRGRNFYFSEIAEGLKEMGLYQSVSRIKKNLISLLVSGKVEMIPANLPAKSICIRCGNEGLKPTKCGICGQMIWYCPQCLSMGESLTCRPLFRRKDGVKLGKKEIESYKPHYSFSLSFYQRKLAQQLSNAFEDEEVQDWLLWAVCGAGKTEITFDLIAKVLKRGGRVLFTSPRREVVRQMEERLKAAFPEVSLVGLYGGAENKLIQAQLTVATVHQLVRFYQAFDLIIFDEVDAYPYQGDKWLKRLIERSRKKDGRLIYLSATPGEDLLRQVRSGKLRVLSLPVRFHKKEVPVPILKSIKLPTVPEFSRMPDQVNEWIVETIYKDLAQLYIFLPTRRMVEIFGRSLQEFYKEIGLAYWVQYTHSKDQERFRKVKEFLQGDFPVLVTTTILERGVTVPKSNVLVLYANQEEIFNYQSLIQMAGRAGRSIKAPYGKVWFVGHVISKEMKKAREWIIRMNEIARERGLLDEKVD